MSVASPVIDFIDAVNRRIHLRSGVTDWNPVDDIYTEVRNLRRTNESLRPFDMFCEALPLVSKGGGKFTGRGLKLLGGTRIVPFDEAATQTVTGELLSDEGLEGSELIDTSGLTSTVRINYQPPPAAEYILTFNEEINNQSFIGAAVTIDVTHGVSGTEFPIGTPHTPVNNFPDARIVADSRNYDSFILIGTLTLDASYDTTATFWEGKSPLLATVVLDGNDSTGSEFRDMGVSGVNNGITAFRDCRIGNLTGFCGTLRECLVQGNITVDPACSGPLVFGDCASGVPGTARPTFDLNGADADFQVRGYEGGLTFEGLTQNRNVSFDFNSGTLEIGPTCTAGTVVIRGTVKVIDNSGAGCTVIREDTLSQSEMDVLELIKAAVAGKATVSPDGQTVEIFAEDGVTVLRTLDVTTDQKQRTVVS